MGSGKAYCKEAGLGDVQCVWEQEITSKMLSGAWKWREEWEKEREEFEALRGKIKHSGHHVHSTNVRITRVKEEGLGNLPNVLRKAPALDGEIEAAAAKDDSEGDARLAKRILMERKGRLLSLPGIFVCPDIKREEEVIEDAEPCKKRILMGEKSRPLNSSGILHYDENGILIPE